MTGSMELTVTSLDTSDKDSLCEPCRRRLTKTENKTASKFCTYCGEALCDDCSDHHQASKASADHIIIDNRSKKVKNGNEVCSVFCNEHPNKKLELFCDSHTTLCCLSCMTKFHRHCERILTIEEAAVGIKNSTWCKNILECLNKSRQQLEKSTSKGKRSIGLCYEKSKSTLEKVDSTRETIRKHLDRLQENFKRSFSQFCTENIKVMEEKVKLFEKQTSLVAKSEEILNNAMSSCSDIEVLLEANRLKLVCSDIEKFIEDHNNQIPDISIEFHLNECIGHFANHFQQLGNYEIKTVDNSRQKPSFAECLLEHIQTIKLLDKSCITGVKFLSDGNIALVDNRYNTLYFYGIEAKKIVEIGLPDGPWDVELLDKNVLIVTFQERPYLQFVDILKRKLRKEIEIDEPKRSIAVFNNQIM